MSVTRTAQHEANRPAPPRLKHLLRLVGLTACLVLCALPAGGSGAGAAAASYEPAADGYSMANLTSQIGASAWWAAGYTGAGVDVALIDTGVTPVPGLGGAGKVVYGPDISLDSQYPNLRNLDGYGHGTFMAGLIAGHDRSLRAPYSQAPAAAYRGVAPDARIVSVKVGASDGGTEVTRVIAAIDWVVRHAHDPGLDIRVINLSYGIDSSRSYTADPLAHAAEQAWKHGIVVVAAAGNTGHTRVHGSPGLADPAFDPYVIGVGGYDTGGTATIHDDSIGPYSAGANGRRAKSPDFVAPGSHVQGLRVPGSDIDRESPQGVLDGRYLRGSGTSEAAAITSGAVALILQKYPTLTPDEVKRFIQRDALKLHGASDAAQGSGELNLAGMLHDAPQGFPAPPPLLSLPLSAEQGDGLGAAEPVAAGPVVVLQTVNAPNSALRGPLGRNARQLTGARDGIGGLFALAAIAQAQVQGDAWPQGSFSGSPWSGNSWSGNSWSGNSWSGNSWSGNSWSGNSWSGNSWASDTWST